MQTAPDLRARAEGESARSRNFHSAVNPCVPAQDKMTVILDDIALNRAGEIECTTIHRHASVDLAGGHKHAALPGEYPLRAVEAPKPAILPPILDPSALPPPPTIPP